ncbi:MAG TPA: hypothetical protein VEB21_07265 [Terriglobales bacterium]|nr:hypothetical protein [Terriglobales bacterium]
MAQGRIPRDELDGPRHRATVARLFPEDNYGFLMRPDGGDEIRFTAGVVGRDEFDELRIGSEVLYDAVQGDTGLDATAVELISVPYPEEEEAEEPLAADDEVPEMPDIWQDEK